MILSQFVSGPPRGGDGDGSDELRPPMDTPPDASTLGVKILLVSLTMLFGGSMIAYLVLRLQNQDRAWDGYRAPGLGTGLLISTGLLVFLSITLHAGVRAIKAGRSPALVRSLAVALACALAFLANQTHNWIALWRVQDERDLAVLLFWILTVVHALHVVGGFPPLIVTIAKAAAGRYSASSWRGVLNCAMYWHFLDAIWVVIAIALWIG